MNTHPLPAREAPPRRTATSPALSPSPAPSEAAPLPGRSTAHIAGPSA